MIYEAASYVGPFTQLMRAASIPAGLLVACLWGGYGMRAYRARRQP